MSPEKIKELRKAMGLTVEAFAEEMYVSKPTVNNWEQGRNEPRGPALKILEMLWDQTFPDDHAKRKA